MDPAKGLIDMWITDFMSMFSGNIIILIPKSKLPNKTNNRIIQLKLKKEFIKNKSIFIKISILNVIFIILSIFSSLYIKIGNYPEYFLGLSIIFLIINFLCIILTYKITKITEKLSKVINFRLLIDFFEHILKLPLKYIHLKDPGEIVKRVDEMFTVNNVLINVVISFVINIILIITFHIILFYIDLFIYFIIYFYLFIVVLITILLNKKTNDKINKTISSSLDYNNILIDYIYGLTSINHIGQKKYIIDKFSTYLNDKLSNECDYTIYIKRNISIKNIINSTFRLMINFYLIYLISNNNYPFENLLIVDFILEILINSINSLTDLIPEIKYINKIIVKLNEFYNIPILQENKNEFKNEFKNGDIIIDNLSFSYNNYINVIKNINIKIKENEKVILKGESGCGKSTLCKILNKEYTEYTGNITIGNKNLKKIDINSLQKNISYSSQYEKIFTGTIRENILMGKKISESKLNKIIDITCLNRILNKKTFGLDTFLHGGGEELSGGERQIILLARALVKKSKILILDETLSEVNEFVEDKIINNLFNNYKTTTIIYISHKNKKNYFRKTINV